MSEATKVIPQNEEADTEVELSAQELLALSGAVPADKRTADQALQPSKTTAVVSARKPDAPQASAHQATRLPLAIILIVGIAGAAHVLTPSESTTPSTTAQTSQETSPTQWPAPEQLAQGEPVRFANPFDTQEVFEFPPGTTQTEARDAVADLLRERAMSRQNPT